MTFGNQMTMRCTIQRGTAATYDTAASFAAHLLNQPCRYWEEAVSATIGGSEQVDRSGDVRLLKLATMIVPSGTDVRARDHVTSVLDRNSVQQLPRSLNESGVLTLRSMAVQGDPVNLGAFLQLSLSAVT